MEASFPTHLIEGGIRGGRRAEEGAGRGGGGGGEKGEAEVSSRNPVSSALKGRVAYQKKQDAIEMVLREPKEQYEHRMGRSRRWKVVRKVSSISKLSSFIRFVQLPSAFLRLRRRRKNECPTPFILSTPCKLIDSFPLPPRNQNSHLLTRKKKKKDAFDFTTSSSPKPPPTPSRLLSHISVSPSRLLFLYPSSSVL